MEGLMGEEEKGTDVNTGHDFDDNSFLRSFISPSFRTLAYNEHATFRPS